MPETALQWIAAVNGLISLGTILFVWLTRSGKEAGEKVGKIEVKVEEAIKERDRKIDVLEDRVSRVEGELKGLPNRDQMHDMQLEMERLRGSINQLSAEFKGSIEILTERLKPVQAMANRTQEALLGERK